MSAAMTPRFEPLNPQRHAGWLMGPHQGYGFLHRVSALEVMADECHRVACDLPVVWWATGAETLGLSAVIPPGRDWPLDSDGAWLGTYIPLMARIYPFAPGEKDPNGVGAYVDINSPMVCPPEPSPGPDWQPWFDAQGEVSSALSAVLEVLRAVFRARQETIALGRALQQLQLLNPLPWPGGGNQFYTLNLEAVGAMPPPVQEVFKRRGWMKAAYAQVQSLGHLDSQRSESDEWSDTASSSFISKRKTD
jgi:hypothetical protein